MTHMNSRSLLWLIGLALAAGSCGDVSRSTQAPVYLNVVRVGGCAPAKAGEQCTIFTNPLLSDVETKGSVFNDPGEVELEAVLKDLGTAASPTTPTTNNDVTITRYRVAYRRADGRNTPGVDVPYGFDGAMTLRIQAGAAPAKGAFQLVRHSSKMETPLVQLASNRSVLTSLAEVTFYGTDRVGNDVSATGTIQIEFANFGDKE